MTQDEIIRSPLGREQLVALAREAGFECHEWRQDEGVEVIVHQEGPITENLERFAARAAFLEREACTTLCEIYANLSAEAWKSSESDFEDGQANAAGNCANLIRLRNPK